MTVTAEVYARSTRRRRRSRSGIPNEQIASCRSARQYRDLIKLIPGVQYTQDQVRGPSAGSSGQDNVYNFDGVNVTLPLFGTLSAEPASHDIAQVTVVKGGAKAIDFNRAGGFDDRLGQQVRHQPVRRPGRLPVPERRHVRGAEERQPSRDTSRTAAGPT